MDAKDAKMLTTLRTVNAPNFTYEMLMSFEHGEHMDIIQEYIDDCGFDDDPEDPNHTDPVIVNEFKRFMDKYMLQLAESRRQALQEYSGDCAIDFRCLSCHKGLCTYYIQQFKDKFDIVDYFCVFSDGEEEEVFLRDLIAEVVDR